MTFPLTMDRHTIALISIIGSSLDMLGALYLAYDLLGGEHGPLRTLTRAVTYGTLFGNGYGLALGPTFGLASGLTHGITLAWELSRAARGKPNPGFWLDTAVSAIRGLGSLLTQQKEHALAVGLKAGLVMGSVTAIGGSCTPLVEWAADHVPEKRMGVIGVGLILAGFAFQSVQYWVVLLDVNPR